MLPSIIILIRASSQFSKYECLSMKKLLTDNASILFFQYVQISVTTKLSSQYTKNYLKAKIHCWKKESSIKFL